MRLGTTLSYDKYDFDFYKEVEFVNTPKQLDNIDCLVLWGGVDIATEIYGETPNKFVMTKTKSPRDIHELGMIHAALKRNIPLLGICRGAQLLCCVAGGKLLQHIENHGHSHKVKLMDEGEAIINCNSSHHQMMLPPYNAKILAIGTEATMGINQWNGVVNVQAPNEVVYFPNINALGVQPHPEWDDSPEPFNQYVTRKIKEYLHPVF